MKPPSTFEWVTSALMRWRGVVSLTYHRIGNGRDSPFDRGLWSATVGDFESQVAWLKANFDLILPCDLEHAVRARRGRHVLITFDDGYQDNFTVAYPIIKASRVPATFFITTGFIDDRRLPWWDEIAWRVRNSAVDPIALPGYLSAPLRCDDPGREQAIRQLLAIYKNLPTRETASFLQAVKEATGSRPSMPLGGERLWMTWDMLREMREGGMTIGGHGVSHQILSRMSPEEQWEEIGGCNRRIEEELGVPVTAFSYPVGKPDCFNSDTRACLNRAGVTRAFSYYGGYCRISDWNNLDIPRIAVEQDIGLIGFRARLLMPWFTRARIRAR